MADTTLQVRLLHPYKTEAQWLLSEEIPKSGEILYTSGGDHDGWYKIGDGTHTWSNLSYISMGGSADWDENDSTDASYVANRSHYRTSLGYTHPINLDASFNGSYEEEFIDPWDNTYSYLGLDVDLSTSEFNDWSDIDLTESTATITIAGVSSTLTKAFDSEYDTLYYYYNDIEVWLYSYDGLLYGQIAFNSESLSTPIILYLPTVSEQFTYSKLNNHYLNGSLIRSGSSPKSELFNGVTPHDAGYASHAEGGGSYSVDIQLSGSAGATTYSVTSTVDRTKEPWRSWIHFSHGCTITNSANGATATIVGYNVSSSLATFTVDETLNSSSALSSTSCSLEIPGPIASGIYSHAEGHATRAGGNSCHAEGEQTYASVDSSHAEGYLSEATSNYAHAQNYGTVANQRAQTAIGTFNIEDSRPSTKVHNGGTPYGNYALIVGNGTSASTRSNAYTLDWKGNGIYAGKITVGTAPSNNMDVATKQYVDNNIPTVPTTVSSFTNDAGYLTLSTLPKYDGTVE